MATYTDRDLAAARDDGWREGYEAASEDAEREILDLHAELTDLRHRLRGLIGA